MRASLVCAAGLLVLNVAVLLRAGPPQLPRKVDDPEIQREAVARVAPPRPGEATLRALRFARYAGWRAVDCPHADPLATLDADVDPTPGREYVIGNRRYGVAMFSEHGELIAMMRGIGCAPATSPGDPSLSLRAHGSRLVLRTVDEPERVVERRGDELAGV